MKLCGVSRACAPSPSSLCPKLWVVSQTDFTSTCKCVCVAGKGGGISMTGVVAPTSQVLRWQHGGGVRWHVAPPVPSVPVSALCPVLCCGKEVRLPLSTWWGWWFPDPPPEDPQIHGCANSALRPLCPQMRRLQIRRASYTFAIRFPCSRGYGLLLIRLE